MNRRTGVCCGIGCAMVHNVDELKAAVENPSIGFINVAAGTYIIPSTIAPTSYKLIEGLGHVQLDWGGAAYGMMFQNAAATHVTYKNLHFVKTGNSYYACQLYNDDELINCEVDTYAIFSTASRILIKDCDIDAIVELRGGDGRIEHCYLKSALTLRDNAARIHISDTTFLEEGYLDIDQKTGATSDRNIVCTNCDFIPTATRTYCVYFRTSTAIGVTCRSVKFNHCLFVPKTASDDCIEVEDDANLTVEDVHFDHCTFRDGDHAFDIPANPTVAKWRFNNGVYDTITTRYNFTDPGDFVYTNDGSGVARRHSIPHQSTIAAAEPFPPVGCCMTWEDTTNNKVYFKVNDPNQGNKKIELT